MCHVAKGKKDQETSSNLYPMILRCILPGIMAVAVGGCGASTPFGSSTSSERESPAGSPFPDDEALQSIFQGFDAFNELVESLPSLTVRIINNTTATARVELVSGLQGPEADFFGDFFGFDPLPSESLPLSEADAQSVLVAPGGTANGQIKCGQVIGVAVIAPFDQPEIDFRSSQFGLYLASGNVQLSGIGTAQEEGDPFTGDLITLARFVQPEQDGIDCQSDVLVITIDTTARNNVHDTESGELIVAAAPGSGTLSLE